MIKVLFTTHKLQDQKLSEGYAFQGKMNSDGTAKQTQYCARFHGAGRLASRLMDDDWNFRVQNMKDVKHTYIQVGDKFVEVICVLSEVVVPRLQVGKIYRVTETATISCHTYEKGCLVELLEQEPETYEGDLIYKVQVVNTNNKGWAGVAHSLELV